MHKLSTALPKVTVVMRPTTTSTGTSLTYYYPWSTLLPWPGLLELQAEKDEFSQQY